MRNLRHSAILRFGVLGACAVAALGVTFDARAAMMTHSDLTSMAFSSDAVVRARRGPLVRKTEWMTETDTVIEKSYKGPFATGNHLFLDYGLYSTQRSFPAPPDAGIEGEEVVLFLTENKDAARQRNWDAGDPIADWWITTSGMRVEQDGFIQRFEQYSNPGGFAAVPQGHDPYDMVNDPRGAVKMTWVTFEPELLSALGRAAAVRRAMDRAGTAEGRDALIEMIGPADPDDPQIPMKQGWIGFYRDRVAEAIVTRIAETKDVTRTLRALVRAHGAVELFMLREDLPREEVIRAASDPSTPRDERVAAIAILGRYHGEDDKPARAAVVKLLGDPDPAIRIAAANAPPPEPRPSEPYAQALARQFRTEKDERALFEEVRSAKDHQLAAILTGRTLAQPLVSAVRSGRVLEVGWETLRDSDLTVKQVVVTATGASARTLTFDRGRLVESRTASSGHLQVALAFDPPLAFGRYDLACDVTLESGKGKSTQHHFTLAPLIANAGAPLPNYPFVTTRANPADAGSSPSPSPSPSSSSAESPPSSPSTIAPPHPTQGCGCELAAESTKRNELASAALFVIALLGLARRGSKRDRARPAR